MATEILTNSAQGGAQQPQSQDPSPQGDVAGAAGAGTPPATFTAEQQATVDRIVAERLQRAKEKWQADHAAKAAADAADAEAKRAAEQGEFQKLYEQEKQARADSEARLRQLEYDALRKDAAAAAGIAQLWQRLQGETAEALAEDAKTLAALMTPAQPATGQPQRSATTQPTPAPQGHNRLTDEERRQRAARTF